MVAIHSTQRSAPNAAPVARPLPMRAPGLIMLDADRMERRARNPFGLGSVRKPRWAGGVPPWVAEKQEEDDPESGPREHDPG